MEEIYKSPEDLICKEGFISWYKKSDNTALQIWDSWIAESDENRKLAGQAVKLLDLIQIQEKQVGNDQLQQAETKLRDAISKSRSLKVVSINRKRFWYAAATVTFLLAAFSLIVFFKPNSKLQLSTQYGQIKKDSLPDGTEVFLNANSKVTFKKDWQNGKTREVWIHGEAFFHVKRTPAKDKFIVHADAFDIEVTGTSFNVSNWNGKSSIVLKEGSVKIHRPGEEVIEMKPGEMVEFTDKRIEKKNIPNQDYLAWMDKRLDFESTSVTDIANIIKEHYGVDIKIEGKETAEQTITAIMPNDNLEVLLKALDATNELQVTKTKDIIIISQENHNNQ